MYYEQIQINLQANACNHQYFQLYYDSAFLIVMTLKYLFLPYTMYMYMCMYVLLYMCTCMCMYCT